MKQYRFIFNMLDKIRFKKRLHKIGKLLYELLEIMSSYYKTYVVNHTILYFFLVAVFNNMRIRNCKILKEKKGKTGDAKVLGKITDKLPAEASLYGDSAYTNYGLENIITLDRKCIIKDASQTLRE